MRIPAILALTLMPLCSQAASNDTDFSGAWVAWICPAGVQRESGRCSNFVLELHQQDGKVCGAHMYSTAGAERTDEGAAPSLSGDIADDTANVVIVSGRGATPARIKAEMKKVNGVLQWQRLGNPPGDYLLPMNTRLTKSRSKTLFAPLFAQELTAACSSVFAMAQLPKADTQDDAEKPQSVNPAPPNQK